MNRYMLDTNTVSHLIRAHPVLTQHVQSVPITSLCISSITEAELRYGLAKRPDATRLHRVVQEFLRCVDILAWESTTAARYGMARVGLESEGKTLAPLDLLIAVHALDTDAVLVTNDQAFSHMPGLVLADWTK